MSKLVSNLHKNFSGIAGHQKSTVCRDIKQTNDYIFSSKNKYNYYLSFYQKGLDWEVFHWLVDQTLAPWWWSWLNVFTNPEATNLKSSFFFTIFFHLFRDLEIVFFCYNNRVLAVVVSEFVKACDETNLQDVGNQIIWGHRSIDSFQSFFSSKKK